MVVAYGAAWFGAARTPRRVLLTSTRRRVVGALPMPPELTAPAQLAVASMRIAPTARTTTTRDHRERSTTAVPEIAAHCGPVRVQRTPPRSREELREAERSRGAASINQHRLLSLLRAASHVSRCTPSRAPVTREHTHTHPSRALPPPPRSHRSTRQLEHPTYSAIHPTYHQTHPSHILAPDSPCARPHPRTALAACSTPEWSHHPPSPLPARAHLAARRSCSPASIAEIAGDARESARRSERSFLPSL